MTPPRQHGQPGPAAFLLNKALADSIEKIRDPLSLTKPTGIVLPRSIPVRTDDSLPPGCFRLVRTGPIEEHTPTTMRITETIRIRGLVYPGGNAGRRARRQDRRLEIAAAPELARSINATIEREMICLAYRSQGWTPPVGLPPHLVQPASPAQANESTIKANVKGIAP